MEPRAAATYGAEGRLLYFPQVGRYHAHHTPARGMGQHGWPISLSFLCFVSFFFFIFFSVFFFGFSLTIFFTI
jgi:hypothetical protein